MYIKGDDHHTYYLSSSGEQHTSRGAYLLLFDDLHFEHIEHLEAKFTLGTTRQVRTQYPDDPNGMIKWAIRKVALTQVGHFMMGSAQLHNHRIYVSGSLGNDGLPLDARKYPGLWDKLPTLPPELANAYWHDHPNALARLAKFALEQLANGNRG